MGDEDQTGSDGESDVNDLDSWEEGPAFGVGEDKDPIAIFPLKSGF